MTTPVDAFVKSPAVRETLMAAPESTTPSGPLPLAEAPALAPFHSDSGFDRRRDVQSPNNDQLKPSKPAGATASEVSFGPFRLLPAQFLLLEGDKPVHLGSRALEILMFCLNDTTSWSVSKN